MLLSAQGVGTNEIMRVTGKAKTCVRRWQERFMQAGVEGLLRDKTRPSRVPPLGDAVAAQVVALTLTEPPGETTHWTAAAMAAACAVSVSSVHRIWRSHGLRPHQVRQFKLSNDPQFAATSSVFTWHPRPMPSCCRLTRKARSRRSTAPSLACR